MGLLRLIVEGFGWEIGRTAAREAIGAAKEASADPPPETQEARERREREEKKRAEKAAKERAKEAKRREKEIDRELAALKKRLK